MSSLVRVRMGATVETQLTVRDQRIAVAIEDATSREHLLKMKALGELYQQGIEKDGTIPRAILLKIHTIYKHVTCSLRASCSA